MTAKRVSVTLEDPDVAALQVLVDKDRLEPAVMRSWAEQNGIPAPTSEAAIMRILVRAGLQAFSQKALEIGYARWAECERSDPDQEAKREARRLRRAERDAAVSE